MSHPIVTLRKSKEANVAFRHPWIFSGALVSRPEDVGHGELVTVMDERGNALGTGTYSAKSSIAVRVFEFGAGDVAIDAAWLAARFREAEQRRLLAGYGPGTATDGYRVVFGEADGVPGLVIDRYRDVFVMQISTAGMDLLRNEIVAALTEAFSPRAIFERSDIPVRKEEGLSDEVGLRAGSMPERVEFSESGMAFYADVAAGQKTGFFLDQKTLRGSITRLAKDRRVLNLFSYTGAHGIAALKGGAAEVLNVDSSGPALEGCRVHADLNGFPPDAMRTEEADVFQHLSAASADSFDMVIIDPPALIKSQRDAEEGRKAYHFLNRAALRAVKDGGIFVTSSCSHHLPEEDLAFILRRASVQAGAELSTLDAVRQSPDHPASVYFPESAYLKSFVFEVRKRKNRSF